MELGRPLNIYTGVIYLIKMKDITDALKDPFVVGEVICAAGFVGYTIYDWIKDNPTYCRQLTKQARQVISDHPEDLSTMSTEDMLKAYDIMGKILERPFVGGRRLRAQARQLQNDLQLYLIKQIAREIVVDHQFPLTYLALQKMFPPFYVV